nr:AEL_HP1_G0051670.mRNA.1.CDS.1 [Saccharomyces cerevisiae]
MFKHSTGILSRTVSADLYIDPERNIYNEGSKIYTFDQVRNLVGTPRMIKNYCRCKGTQEEVKGIGKDANQNKYSGE